MKRTVNVDLLREEGVERDDWVLIHVGVAMSKISKEEAQEQLDLLRMMGEADAAVEEMQADAAVDDPLGERSFTQDSAEEQTFRDEPPGGDPVDGEPSEQNPTDER